MMKKVFLLFLTCLLAFNVSAQRAAVMEFKAGVGVSQADVDGISAIFITYFRPSGYTMVERTQIDRVIDEQRFQRSSMTESQMVRIGQILHVSKIVVGDVNVVMGQYNVDVRVLNVESGTIAATEGATFSGSSYRETMKSIAQKLAEKIAIKPGATVQPSSQSTSSEYVDLGLPSGTKWKSSNEKGGFFTYDKAMQYFGSKMPTKEQFEELKDLCDWEWTGDGCKVTGPSNKSIVLPAAGFRDCDGYVYGSGGYYWSSTPFGSDLAWYLYFNSGEVDMSHSLRCLGHFVRLVQ